MGQGISFQVSFSVASSCQSKVCVPSCACAGCFVCVEREVLVTVGQRALEAEGVIRGAQSHSNICVSGVLITEGCRPRLWRRRCVMGLCVELRTWHQHLRGLWCDMSCKAAGCVA